MSTAQRGGDGSDTGRVVLGSLLYAGGSAILYVLPAYLGELSSRLGINEAQMGSISAAENVGIALASLASMLWLTRVSLRWLAIFGTLFCCALNIVAFFGHRFDYVLVARFLTGLLGEGILFSLAFSVLGATRDPDRSFGIGLTVVVVFGSMVLAISSLLDRVPSGTGAVLPLAILPLGILFALRWMPLGARAGRAQGELVAAGSSVRLAIWGVTGMTVWFAAPGAFWSFAESAASARAVPNEVISIALAIGNAAGLLGSVVAAWQGDRYGRMWPIALATVGLGLSVVAFGRCTSVAMLALMLALFNVCWNYATVYQMALVAALDTAGRVAPGIPAAQVVGFAAGGFLCGEAITGWSYSALPIVVGLFGVVGVLVLAPCFKRSTPP